MDSGERYSINAVLALYRFEPEIVDVYVEGRTDVGLLEWYFNEKGIRAKVFAIDDRVEVDGGILRDYGLDIGARGRVLALAMLGEAELGVDQSALTCVVDADYTRLIGPVPFTTNCLLTTDGAALDCYAMQLRPLGKLLRAGLRLPSTVVADEVIEAIGPALLDIYCVRAALFVFGIPCVAAPEKDCTLKAGSSRADIETLIKKAMSGIRRDDWPIDPGDLAQWARDLRKSEDVELEVAHGHDIARLLAASLKLKGPLATLGALEAAMRLSLEVEDLSGKPLFVALENRFAS